MERRPTSLVAENQDFFCEGGHEFSGIKTARETANTLVKAGRIAARDTQPLAKGDYMDIFGPVSPMLFGKAWAMLGSAAVVARLVTNE